MSTQLSFEEFLDVHNAARIKILGKEGGSVALPLATRWHEEYKRICQEIQKDGPAPVLVFRRTTHNGHPCWGVVGNKDGRDPARPYVVAGCQKSFLAEL